MSVGTGDIPEHRSLLWSIEQVLVDRPVRNFVLKVVIGCWEEAVIADYIPRVSVVLAW